MKQFRVVNLQQHPCDLPSQIGMLALCEAGNMKIIMVEVGVPMKTSSAQIEAVLKYLDEGEESLAEHLLLLLHRSSRQHCSGKGLLDRISQH